MASRVSPYNNAPAIEFPDGSIILGEYNQSDQPSLESNLLATHVIKEGETLQSIAYQYYNDSGYWYRLMVFNNIINPLEVKPFTRIFIPR